MNVLKSASRADSAGGIRRRLFHHGDFHDAVRAMGAPTYKDVKNVETGRFPSLEGRRSLLAEGISCISWDLTFDRFEATGSLVARLGLTVDPAAGRGQAQARQRRWHKIQAAIVLGILPWTLLLTPGVSWLAWATALIFGALFIVGAVIAKNEACYLSTLDVLLRWLDDDERIEAAVPRSWETAADDSEARALIIQWLRTAAEVEALEDHVAEGVRLRKHLSPVDPRRKTMQAEIETRRAKRDALNDLQAELASRITSAADAFIEERERVRQEKSAAAERKAAEQAEQQKFQQRWERINEQEGAHVKRHEDIDEWFDKGSPD